MSERVESYHIDMLGSVQAAIDAQGHVVAHHDFLPFGEEYHPAGPIPVPRSTHKGSELRPR